MKTYFDCWAEVAAALFSQALAGEPELAESLPKPLGAGSFGWAATLKGDVEGRFAVLLDGALLETSLVGEGVDQKAGWEELVRESVSAAAGELLARSGKKCQVTSFEEIAEQGQTSSAFQLRAGDRAWTVLVRDELRGVEDKMQAEAGRRTVPESGVQEAPGVAPESPGSGLTPGLELLLDVELEASLRFGAREMPLGEILDLGPGDVVELDRHVADPVDLIVGDKIVARGEVVLVNGNFGLRVTEVAAPRKRLESVRCLF
jgi:flagellar motor switch protein FliN